MEVFKQGNPAHKPPLFLEPWSGVGWPGTSLLTSEALCRDLGERKLRVEAREVWSGPEAFQKGLRK